jgi:vacuolar-type H+-ATPase subunit I/STV1
MVEEGYAGGTARSGWHTPVIIIIIALGLLALAGLIVGWRANARLGDTEQAVTAQVTAMKNNVDQDVTALKDRLTASEKSSSDLQSDLSVVTKKLRITEGQLKDARAEAAKLRQETSDKLTALDSSMKTELANKADTDDLKTVDTKVGGVRTDLDATREDLKMARSELGTLIARNHEEVEELRRLGERDYVEFTITGKKPQKVGNITIELHGTNASKNLFSVALTVEDRRFVKKNHLANEPIFFYTTGARQPEEVVVNKVSKDQVTGYLSVPKASGQQPAASASSSSGGQ